MIEPRELMLGCYVQAENGYLMEVSQIKHNVAELSNYNTETVSQAWCEVDFLYAETFPIELTDEWIEKLGFTKHLAFKMALSEKKTLEVAWNDVGKWYVFYREKNTEGEDDIVVLRNDLAYVHQLQILLYSLTGTMPQLKLITP